MFHCLFCHARPLDANSQPAEEPGISDETSNQTEQRGKTMTCCDLVQCSRWFQFHIFLDVFIFCFWFWGLKACFIFFEDLGRGRPWVFSSLYESSKRAFWRFVSSEGLLPSILKKAEKRFLFPFLHIYIYITYFHCIYTYIYTHYLYLFSSIIWYLFSSTMTDYTF